MRAVVQRVKKARVIVGDREKAEIDRGLLVYLGVGQGDTLENCHYLVEKTVNLRIFHDTMEKMNLSVMDIQGEVLVVSQFTLYGDCRKGRRPNFMGAAEPAAAEELYELFVAAVKAHGLKVEKGCFGEMMQIESVNDGPVTILLDSSRVF